MKSGGDPIQKKIDEQRKKEKEKKEQEQKEKEMVNSLFKPVVEKVDKSKCSEFNISPKYILFSTASFCFAFSVIAKQLTIFK